MGERLVVIGGDAGGMSAASTARRLRPDLDIVAFEKGEHTSYSACGIPYLVGGEVHRPEELIARTPQEFRDQHRIDVRIRHEAMAIDLDRREVEVRDHEHDRTVRLGFDHLLIGTGARPRRPDIPGIDLPHVHGVQTLGDGARLLAWIEEHQPARAVVVGGGYIGLEMAEAMVTRGFHTTLVTRHTIMSSLDPEMSDRILAGLVAAGVHVVTGHTIESAHTVDGRVDSVTTDDGTTYPADLVVLAIGLRPSSDLGADAGLPIGEHGGYLTDAEQLLGDGVWAAGDCCETIDRTRRIPVFVPLGTHANKQGRICGYNLLGGHRTFPGILGTAITRFSAADVHVEIARTGVSTAQAKEAGFDAISLVTESGTASGYMAEHSPIATNVIADRATRRLLGMQIVGGANSGKRIDTAAAAMWGEMSIDDLAAMDLSYAPPFATVWEAVQLAARRLADRL